MEIKGKNILITGGLGELGKAVTGALYAAGAAVYCFDKKQSDDERCFQVDISDEKEVQKALEHLDKIDILINCAGEIYSEPILNVLKKERHKRENWDRVINNNLTSCFNMSTQVAQKMIKSRTKGVIINFSSISANGNMGQVAYSAAKAGVEAMTKVFAKELGMFKIRTCAIAPGFIETESTRTALSEGLIEHWMQQTPLRKLGEPDDIIKSIFYIIECDYLSGCTLSVDGALTI